MVYKLFSNREKYIEKLSTENGLLREKVETLYEELSLKEATWSDWKERSKKKVSAHLLGQK